MSKVFKEPEAEPRQPNNEPPACIEPAFKIKQYVPGQTDVDPELKTISESFWKNKFFFVLILHPAIDGETDMRRIIPLFYDDDGFTKFEQFQEKLRKIITDNADGKEETDPKLGESAKSLHIAIDWWKWDEAQRDEVRSFLKGQQSLDHLKQFVGYFDTTRWERNLWVTREILIHFDEPFNDCFY